SAFANTTGYGALDFVRCANSLIAVFNEDSIGNRILHTVAAPRTAYTTFYSSQRFAVSMTTFKTFGDEFFPDLRQLFDAGPKHVDALTAGDFGVESVFGSYSSQ